MTSVVPLYNDNKGDDIFIMDHWFFEPNPDRYACIKERFNTHYTPIIYMDLYHLRDMNGCAPLIGLLNELLNAVPVERTLIIHHFYFRNVTHELLLLFDMIRHSSSIVHLCFDWCRSSTVLGDLLPQLRGKTNLKSLHFKSVFFKTQNALHVIQNLILDSPNLKSFVFQRSSIQDQLGYCEFYVFVDALLSVPSLTYLDFSYNFDLFTKINPRNDELLARLIDNSPFLKVFKIRHTIPPHQETPWFLNALRNHKVLEDLDIIDTYRNFTKQDPDPKYVQTHNPYLSHLLAVNNSLKTVYFNSGFSVNNTLNIGILLSNNPSLTTLDLYGTQYINDYEMEVFASHLATNTTLKTLSLKCCVMHPKCLEFLGKALVKNNTLESLKLDQINSVEFSLATDTFFSFLEQNKGLRYFSMLSTKTGFNDTFLYRALRNHPTIETLRTDHNAKPGYNPVDMHDMLTNNHTLRDVEIRFGHSCLRYLEPFYKSLTAAIINNKNLIRFVIPSVAMMHKTSDMMYEVMQHENTNIIITQRASILHDSKDLCYQVLKRNRALNNTLFNLLFPAINWVDPQEDEECLEPTSSKRFRLH